MKFSKQTIYCNINELLLVMLLTQYMGALGNFENAIPKPVAHVIYLVYNTLFMFYAIYGLFYVLYQKQKWRVTKQYLLYVGFFVYVFISGIVATKDYNTFFEGVVRLIGTASIACYIGYYFSMEKIASIAIRAQTVVVAMIWYMYIFRPSDVLYSDPFFKENLVGLFTTKNTCAYELAFGLVVTVAWCLFYSKGSKRVAGLLLLIAQIPLFIICHAVGAVFCIAFTFIIFVVYYIKKNKNKLGSLFIFITALFWASVYVILPLIGSILAYFGKSVTLTGRTSIWNGILQYASESNFWIGEGYGTFWINEKYVSSLWSIYSSLGLSQLAIGAHNLLLEMLLQVGAIGVILFIALVLQSMNRVTVEKNDGKQFLVLIVLFYTIRSLVERTFNYMSYDLLFFLIAISYCIWSREEKIIEDDK